MNTLTKNLLTALFIVAVIIISFWIGHSTQSIPQPEQKPMTHADSVWEAQYAEYEADLNKDTACVRKGCNIPTLGGFIAWREHKAKEAALINTK